MNTNQRLAHAAEYLRLARSCRDPSNRLQLLRLAYMWGKRGQPHQAGLETAVLNTGRKRPRRTGAVHRSSAGK
jgi:hypothetical protein